MTREVIHEAIDNERSRQDRKWGGQNHDDGHTKRDWISFIVRQLAGAESATTPGEYTAAMVKVAALSVAAIESVNRKAEQLQI